MFKLMDWHFSVQQGMYFDKRKQTDGYVIYSSDIIKDGFWNYAFPTAEIALENYVSSIESDFKSLNRLPCIYLPNDSRYEERRALLGGRGYAELSDESVMLYGVNPPEIYTKGALEIRLVTDAKTADDFIDVFTNAYGGEKTPEQPYGELDDTYITALSRSFADTQKFFHYVCYDGKTPVSIASLCFADGKGGLYNVGTSPSARGKGYGTIATKACIDKWRKMGGTELFLQTETGSAVESWYFKLGFELQFVGRSFSKEND